jgi:3-hydroxymyristoyl/3-hydroxydecanoyl-(acyl carrier protein) dehydratase
MEADRIEGLARAGRRRPIYVPEPGHAVDLGRAAIERLLQHRPPFLFVDAITAVDLTGLAIEGRRVIRPDDPVFAGHFPGDPIYPGVLQIETMGQVGLCLFALARNGRVSVDGTDVAHPIRGLKIHHAVFLEAVRPGAELRTVAKVLESDAYTGTCAGQLYAGDTLCCFAIMEVYFVDT